jgi:hypothetical protein
MPLFPPVSSGGGGAWQFIQTASNAAATQVDFTGLASYRELLLHCYVISSSAGNSPQIALRYSTDNGVNFDATSVYYSGRNRSNQTSADARITNSSATQAAMGVCEVLNFNQSRPALMIADGWPNSNPIDCEISYYTPTTARNALRVISSAGIQWTTSSFFTLYGKT